MANRPAALRVERKTRDGFAVPHAMRHRNRIHQPEKLTDGISGSAEAMKLALDQLWDHVLNVASRFRVNVGSVTDDMQRRARGR